MELRGAARRRAEVAAVFDRVADVYDNVGVPWFTPVAEALVAAVAPRPGARALDIGCGRGAALFALAEAVGPTGRVTGIDLSSRMVEATRAEAADRGVATVSLAVMDAAAPELPAGSFDVAVASFVAFFLPGPAAALRAWRGLLAPGGVLGLSTFADHHQGWLDGLFERFLPPRAFTAPSPFDSDEGVARLLESAGFSDIGTSTLELPVEFRDLEHWRTWSWSHGQRAVWDRIPASRHGEVLAASGELLAPHRRADGSYRLTQPIRLTTARPT